MPQIWHQNTLLDSDCMPAYNMSTSSQDRLAEDQGQQTVTYLICQLGLLHDWTSSTEQWILLHVTQHNFDQSHLHISGCEWDSTLCALMCTKISHRTNWVINMTDYVSNNSTKIKTMTKLNFHLNNTLNDTYIHTYAANCDVLYPFWQPSFYVLYTPCPGKKGTDSTLDITLTNSNI